MMLLPFALVPAAMGIEKDPTETYQAFHRALRLLDMEGIRSRWLPREAVAENEETLTKEILWLHQMLPPEIEVRDEKIMGKDAFLTVIGYYPNGGKSEGKIYLMKTFDRWKVRDESWGFIILPPPPPTKGDGVIEGIVTIPSLEAQGNLYVFAVLKNRDSPSGFAVIPKDQIVWHAVPYRIPNLAPGTYRVHAYWDTAPPYMDPEKRDFSVFTGDFAGEFVTSVTLYEKETRSRIDFAMTRNLKAKEEENYGTIYSLIDVGVTLGPEGKPLFLLSMRNTGDRPIRNISLVCIINGKELTYSASAPGPLIFPQEVREFDITTCYESYLFFLERVWAEEALSKDRLAIEIVSKDNESRLKKEIVL